MLSMHKLPMTVINQGILRIRWSVRARSWRPFMAGCSKDLVPFIEQNFEMGKVYPIQHVQKVFSEHISGRIEHVHKRLSGLVMTYLEDRNKSEKPLVLTNHSTVNYKRSHIVWFEFPYLSKLHRLEITSGSREN